MAVGAMATGELTGVPEQGGGGRRPRRCPASTWGWSCQWPQAATLPCQQALVVGPARVVGVGHLPDDVAGLALEVSSERSVTRGAGRSRSPARVVPRRVGAGRMSGHGPHGRRRHAPIPFATRRRCRAILVCRVDDGPVVSTSRWPRRPRRRATTPWSCPTASATPRSPTPRYPFNPDGTREFLEDKPFLEPFSLIPAMGAVTEHAALRHLRDQAPHPPAGAHRQAGQLDRRADRQPPRCSASAPARGPRTTRSAACPGSAGASAWTSRSPSCAA